jgi:hypothetical protein
MSAPGGCSRAPTGSGKRADTKKQVEAPLRPKGRADRTGRFGAANVSLRRKRSDRRRRFDRARYLRGRLRRDDARDRRSGPYGTRPLPDRARHSSRRLRPPHPVRALILRGTFELPQFETRPFLAITAATASFALAIETLGAVPAIVIMTLVARLADERVGFIRPLILGCLLALIATLIFSVGLELPIYPFIRPF